MRSRIGAAAIFAALCCAALAVDTKGQRRLPHIDINNLSKRQVEQRELPSLSKPRNDRRALQAAGVCSQACYKGQGDCCDVIATSVLYAAVNEDRVVRYDPVGDTFERFAEDRVNMSRILAIDTSKPWDAYPDDLLVLRQTSPSFSRVFDDVINTIELYDKTGRHVKTLIDFADQMPGLSTMQAMTLGPNDTLFLGSFEDGVFLWKYSSRILGVFGDGVLQLPNVIFFSDSLAYILVAPSAIAVDSQPNGDMTVYVLYTRTVECESAGSDFVCTELTQAGEAIVPSITSYYLTFADGAYELAGVFTEYFTLPDYQGLEVLDSGDVVISGRSSDWQLRLVLYTPVFGGAGGFWVFMNSDPGYSIDAWHVKKAPNGLLYVSDFTAFTSSIVVTQNGDPLGQLAATLGYNAGVQGIAFTHGAFATRCNFTSLPDFANAGDSVTVNVTLTNAFGEAVDDELFLELSWQTLSNSALTLIALDVSSACTRQDVGQYQCVFSPAQATLAFPMEDDEMHVADELLDYLGVTDPHNLTDAELEPFAVQLKVAVSSFRVQVPATTPQRMFVAPTVPSATYSTMLTSSLSLAAGETGRANLMLADVFGNALATGGYDSSLKIAVTTMLNGTYDVGDLHWEGYDQGSFVRLQDQGDGLYTLEAALFTAGTALVQIFLDDVQVKNSPVTIVSIASMDNVSPTTTAVQGLGLDAFDVGDWNSFTLQARDKFGNNIAFSAEIADSAPTSPVPSPMSIADYFDVHFKAGNPKYEVVGMWQQHKDGTFEVMYRVAYPQDPSAGADAEFQFTDRWAYPRSVEITVEYNGTVVEMPSSSSTAVAQQSLVFKKYQQQERLNSLGLAIAVLGAVMVIAHAVYIIVQWNHKIMEFSQQRFLLAMCIGVLMLFAFICVSYAAPSKGTCNAEVWLSHLGFVLTVGALSIKTWRVSHLAAHPEKVENKTGMQAVDRHARWTMVAVVVLTAAYLAIWTALDPSERVEVTTHDESSQGTTIRYKADICSSSGPDFRVPLNVFEIALLAAGAVLAYDTRNVHEVFAEAKWIGVSLYNIIVVGGVAALMYTGFGLSHSRPDVAYAMLSVCMLVAAGGAINFIMVPKILAILRNEQVDIADLTTSHEMVKSSPSREQIPSVQPMSELGSISRLPSASKDLSSVVM